MPDDGRIIELFARARQAEWAGDVEPARRLIQALWEEADIEFTLPDEHPIAVILERARLIHARLEQIHEEVPEELVVQTNNLRGIIWRTGERNFELRAYLRELAWENELYRRAHAVARRYPPLLNTAETTESEEGKSEREAQLPLYEGQDKESPDAGRGASWAMDGDGYLREVTVGDFALARVKVVWTKRGVPKNFLIVRKLMEEPLLELDGSGVLSEQNSLILGKE